jgi:hypothetical protein
MGSDPKFLVAAMYTDAYADKAERLRESCARFGLPHELRRVPVVHDSISKSGVPNPAFTKSSFILDVLAQRRRPVLYVDADVVFRSAPVLIGELLAGGTEFAIYNWAADRQADAYVPVPIVMAAPDGAQRSGPRFFRFASKFVHYDPSQLLCSGAAQLYADTPAARALLEAWQQNILRFPGSADDHCMDYTYNNRGAALAGLRASWLPRAYARYAWWITTEPVIDHPEFAAVATHFRPVPEVNGAKQFYPERAQLLEDEPQFPRDGIIDVHARRLLKIENKAIVHEEPIDKEFWT